MIRLKHAVTVMSTMPFLMVQHAVRAIAPHHACSLFWQCEELIARTAKEERTECQCEAEDQGLGRELFQTSRPPDKDAQTGTTPKKNKLATPAPHLKTTQK